MQDEGEVFVPAPGFPAYPAVEVPAQVHVHATVIGPEPLYQLVRVEHDVVVADVAVQGKRVVGQLEFAEGVELEGIGDFGHVGKIGRV
jgi:hypothetical protein